MCSCFSLASKKKPNPMPNRKLVELGRMTHRAVLKVWKKLGVVFIDSEVMDPHLEAIE